MHTPLLSAPSVEPYVAPFYSRGEEQIQHLTQRVIKFVTESFQTFCREHQSTSERILKNETRIIIKEGGMTCLCCIPSLIAIGEWVVFFYFLGSIPRNSLRAIYALGHLTFNCCMLAPQLAYIKGGCSCLGDDADDLCHALSYHPKTENRLQIIPIASQIIQFSKCYYCAQRCLSRVFFNSAPANELIERVQIITDGENIFQGSKWIGDHFLEQNNHIDNMRESEERYIDAMTLYTGFPSVLIDICRSYYCPCCKSEEEEYSPFKLGMANIIRGLPASDFESLRSKFQD